MWGGFEARKFPRLKTDCTITLQNFETEAKLESITENIGVGGICVLLKDSLPRFSRLKLKLEINDGGNPISCDARVVWVVPSRDLITARSTHDTGIEFTNLTPRDRDRIERFVKTVQN